MLAPGGGASNVVVLVIMMTRGVAQGPEGAVLTRGGDQEESPGGGFHTPLLITTAGYWAWATFADRVCDFFLHVSSWWSL